MPEMEKVLVDARTGLPPELMAQYLANCRSSLHSLKEAVDRQDYEYLRVYGHKMKGCGRAYGFPVLTDHGREIESAAIARNQAALLERAFALEQDLGRMEIPAE